MTPQEQEDNARYINMTNESLKKVTRFEVIEKFRTKGTDKPDGRVYNHWDMNTRVELSLQDNGMTLKVFILKRPQGDL